MCDILNRLKYRTATPGDVNFIVDCIIEAEKSGTQTINTCRIFNLTEHEWRKILTNILLEDIPNYEFSLSGFLVAELEGRPVCTQGAWYTDSSGIESGLIKTSMYLEYIPKEKFNINPKISKLIKALSIKRDQDMIQLEYSYTIPELRRKGIFTHTLIEALRRNYAKNPAAKMIQTIFFKENYPIHNRMKSLGFGYAEEKKVDDPAIFDLFAYNAMIKMNLTIDKMKEIISYCNVSI